MTTNPKDQSATAENQTEETVVDAAAANEAANAPEESAAPEVTEEDVLLKLTRENEELKDRALRLAAEMENLRRRTQRDVADARAFSIANFARDMLVVSDNLQRALQAVPAEARESGENGLKALIEGVEMTERLMLSTLERHGVKRIEAAEGQRFDPNFHQAMFEVPNPEVPANTVVQVVQAGYVIGERVLRPALVGVSTGGPKAAPAEQPSANGAADVAGGTEAK